MNIKQLLRSMRDDPLARVVGRVRPADIGEQLIDPFNSYLEQYSLFYECYERVLTTVSLYWQYEHGPLATWRSGGRYSDREKALAKRFHEVRGCLLLDFHNLLIHSRILLDRVLPITQTFLSQEDCPNYRSFHGHRDFFLREENTPHPTHEEYAHYVRENTQWFDPFLKVVRDKLIMHRQAQFWRFFGWPGDEPRELTMIFWFAGQQRPPFGLEGIQGGPLLEVRATALVDNIHDYLTFLAQYADRHGR